MHHPIPPGYITGYPDKLMMVNYLISANDIGRKLCTTLTEATRSWAFLVLSSDGGATQNTDLKLKFYYPIKEILTKFL